MVEKPYDATELEYRVNKYTLRCLKIMMVCMLCVWLANILDIFIINQRLMALGAIQSILPVAATLVFARFGDLRKSWVKYVLLFSAVLSVTMIGCALTYHAILLSVIPLLIATQYIDKKVLAYTYVLTVISVFIVVMGGYFYGLCDVNMLMLTTESTNYYINMLKSTGYLGEWNMNPWVTLPLYFVVPRCALLFLLLPVIQSISKNIINNVQYAESMKMRSETDEMTGLYNRNKYLEMADTYYPGIEKISVIFFDVNGLKQVNDTLGHDVGDDLIKNVADCIKHLETSKGKGYRMGGDEFVLVMENPKDGEFRHVLDNWETLMRENRYIAELSCSVAIGTASGAGKDIEKLTHAADQSMYQKKEEYHSEHPEGASVK